MSDLRSLKEILDDCTARFARGRAPADEPVRTAPKREASRAAPENATIPASFRWATLDAGALRTRVSRVPAIADAAAALTSTAAATSTGLLLVGPSGSGKTSLACALLRAWDARYPGRRGVFMSAWKLGVARAQHGLGHGEPPEVERAMTARLLVLDDLGSERNTATNAVPDVIFARALEGLPTWVTTWMTADAVTQRYGDGIARRLYEAGRVAVIACGSAG